MTDWSKKHKTEFKYCLQKFSQVAERLSERNMILVVTNLHHHWFRQSPVRNRVGVNTRTYIDEYINGFLAKTLRREFPDTYEGSREFHDRLCQVLLILALARGGHTTS